MSLTASYLAEAATAANGLVHALLGPAKILFPLANPNGCTATGGGLGCPLAVGPELTYIANLNVPSYAPSVCVLCYVWSSSLNSVSLLQGVSLIVEWELQDQNGADIWCFEASDFG